MSVGSISLYSINITFDWFLFKVWQCVIRSFVLFQIFSKQLGDSITIIRLHISINFIMFIVVHLFTNQYLWERYSFNGGIPFSNLRTNLFITKSWLFCKLIYTSLGSYHFLHSHKLLHSLHYSHRLPVIIEMDICSWNAFYFYNKKNKWCWNALYLCNKRNKWCWVIIQK